jgi:glycosyltransferase involved in cell wall biosynthesis
MTSDAITKVLEDVQPTLVHHQGHRQDVVVDVCTMMNIPLLSGYHFWHGAIILGPKLNQNILHHLKEHKPDPKLISIYKKTNTHLYACSEFLQDVIHSVTGALLPVWNPVPIFHSLPPNDPTSSKFITWMHIHPLKGGTIVTSLMCILHEFPFQAIECEMPRYRTNVTDTIKEIAASRSASDPPILIKERQEDPSDIYRKTKVLLIPSIVDETFSRVSLEGLAHGIPIITTGSGYIKEMVGDGGIVLGMDSPIEEWAFNVRMLYSNDVVYKDISRRARLRYERIYAQKGMDGFKKMIRMALTPERKERHVMLFCPWCDQGLGIQSRQYAQSLLQKGICVSIFGFRPYYVETKEMDSRFQEDFDEWSMYDVYYSKNVRERVTDDEIIAFTKSRGITDCIIPETCWFRVFQIAQVLHDLEIRVHAVPNIEIVRKDELEKHDVFDSILCPNHICYDVLAKEREVLRPKLKYVGFTCPVCPIVPKMASSEEPFRFVLIGGMNGFFRKNCLKVCAGFVEAKKSLEGTAHSNIELVLTLQGNMRDIEQYRNIEGIRIIHQHQTHAQIWQHIASANVFVFVSRQEGLGLGMYEALACGTPVLTLDRPPFHEVIQEGRNGWVIPGFDVPNLENNSAVVSSHDFDQHDLSEKMRDIVVQKEGYQQIRKNTLVSREQIRRMFDIDFTSLFL